MNILFENWFFVLVLLACLGMHVLGHGHSHENRSKSDNRKHEGLFKEKTDSQNGNRINYPDGG